MVIDSLLLDKLTAQAKESPRLRMNLDLKTSETVVVLRGRVVEVKMTVVVRQKVQYCITALEI